MGKTIRKNDENSYKYKKRDKKSRPKFNKRDYLEKSNRIVTDDTDKDAYAKI